MKHLTDQIVMGTFTHRTTYLQPLLDSIQKYYPKIFFITHIESNPINKNMEGLRKKFLATNRRYWIYLDDDIQFLDSDTVYQALEDLINFKLGICGVYSTFDKNYKIGDYPLEFTFQNWVPGYFMLIDRVKAGHIQPDLNLPDPNTSVDTTFCMKVKTMGFDIGMSKGVILHAFKKREPDPKLGEKVTKTNNYLQSVWGQSYFNTCTQLKNIVGKYPPEEK